ncbi:hypothetical protein ES705_21173 [subsurface metagenome]
MIFVSSTIHVYTKKIESSTVNNKKIFHINDIANVGKLLVDGQKNLGYDSQLFNIKIPFAKQKLIIKLLFLPLRLFYLIKLNRFITNEKPDIVHIHYAYLGWLGILGRYKYYLHCHGADVRFDLNHPITKLWVKKSLKRAEKVFYSTPDLRQVLQKVRPDSIFIPNPVEIVPLEKKPEINPIKILIFSEIDDKKKGSNIAFDVSKIINDWNNNIEIHALKFGKDLQKYEKIKWIQFHDKLNRSDVIPFINTFNIIIGQFSYGSIGVAELESMSCKKPVISYFNYPNFYDEVPPILKTKDPHLIAEYIKEIIIDNKIIKVGEKCFNWVKENHEFNNIAKKITEYYDFQQSSQ